jgi:hypothetical protein
MNDTKNNSIKYEVFRGDGGMTWDRLFAQASEFASSLKAEQIISISHSSDSGKGTVTVWYRAQD